MCQPHACIFGVNYTVVPKLLGNVVLDQKQMLKQSNFGGYIKKKSQWLYVVRVKNHKSKEIQEGKAKLINKKSLKTTSKVKVIRGKKQGGY